MSEKIFEKETLKNLKNPILPELLHVRLKF